MKDLGITKGEWQHNKHSRGNVEANGRSIAGCMGYSTNMGNGDHIDENYANAELVIDAGNTAQKCGLLPSELLKQRDELKEALVSMVEQFAYRGTFEGRENLHTGGLSALEDAFDALGLPDPVALLDFDKAIK